MVQKICNWPECQNLTQVCRFLDLYEVLQIFIQNFASITWPLIDLTHKGVPFDWGKPQQLTMACLKDAICHSSALQWLDYESGQEVVLAIDISVIVVGFILSQDGEDGKWYLNRFCSIGLTEVESYYSQAKLELHRLFQALQAVQIFIFGVTNLTVEMNAKYVKGMINNLDLQPNATINWWIAGILLFSFRLIHIPANCHMGTDGLSCQPPSEHDPPEEDDYEDWLDNAYFFSVLLLNVTIAHFFFLSLVFLCFPFISLLAEYSIPTSCNSLTPFYPNIFRANHSFPRIFSTEYSLVLPNLLLPSFTFHSLCHAFHDKRI